MRTLPDAMATRRKLQALLVHSDKFEGVRTVGLAVFVEHPLGLYVIGIGECERYLMHMDLGLDRRVLSLAALENEFVILTPRLHAHVRPISEHAIVSECQAILVDKKQ